MQWLLELIALFAFSLDELNTHSLLKTKNWPLESKPEIRYSKSKLSVERKFWYPLFLKVNQLNYFF